MFYFLTPSLFSDNVNCICKLYIYNLQQNKKIEFLIYPIFQISLEDPLMKHVNTRIIRILCPSISLFCLIALFDKRYNNDIVAGIV